MNTIGNPDRHVPVTIENVKNQLARVATRIDKSDPNFDAEIQTSLDAAVEMTAKQVGEIKKVTPLLHNAIVILAAALFNKRETPDLYWELIAPYRQYAF